MPVQAQQLVKGIAAVDRCRRRRGGGFHLGGPNEAADHAAGRSEVHLGPNRTVQKNDITSNENIQKTMEKHHAING